MVSSKDIASKKPQSKVRANGKTVKSMRAASPQGHRRQNTIAIVIPCLNEEHAIGKVIAEFMSELPAAHIYVFDNDSTDQTASVANRAGAIVVSEHRRGKGNVVRSIFRQVDADIYVLVDGDDTYPAGSVKDLIWPIINGEADMVIASRLTLASKSSFRSVNRFGNEVFLFAFNSFFRTKLTDLLTGYRALSRTVVNNLTLLSDGFEIETEMTIQALEKGFRIDEISVNLRERTGSKSKIKIWQDGFLILHTIFVLFRDYRPLSFFGGIGALLLIPAILLGWIVISDYLQTGLVAKFPSAFLAVGLVLSSLLCFAVGLILGTLSRRFRELDHRLSMLANKPKADARVGID